MSTIEVLQEVVEEREAQDRQFSEQNHHPSRYFDIFMEEVGEVAKALVEAQAFADQGEPDVADSWWYKYRRELIDAAAVAVGMAESFDRNGPPVKKE